MNRKNLTAAVLAGLAGAAGIVGSAQAVNINPDGLGQVLIYPYYTVNGGNVTLLSVVNTTEDAKAVKVRFTEGQNTREVLDFNLYLSAYDVWAAGIVNVDGTPTLYVNDTSCTVPYIYGNGGTQEFLPYALTDGGATTIDRAREGHFEMIEMGTLIDDSEASIGRMSATAATHVAAQACTTEADGACPAVPANCQQLVDAWTDPDDTVAGDEGYWLQDPFTDLTAPSGGLFGGASIINVSEGFMTSYDAKAINGFATMVDANDVLHQEPGNVLPGLNSGDVVDGTVFLDTGATLTSTGLTRGVDAVSFVFMHDQIMNEYTTEDSVAAGTEWVVTFPTKHFYVYPPSSGSDTPVDPFTSTWQPVLTEGACEVVLLDTLWNREEQSFIAPIDPGDPVPPIVSPAPPGVIDPVNPIIPFELCYETSVIRFGAVGPTPKIETGTEILGSVNYHNIDNTELGYETGWARLQLEDYPHDANGDGIIDKFEAELKRQPLGSFGDALGLAGLPVTGFAVYQFDNGFLGDGADVLAHYGGIFQHKGTRKLASMHITPK
ncbi:MAG: hypothetical protein DRQ98_12320 [Gammaproteobacteria bacterium]|nr:MAG: hypothetical protein DRQ98_12320 [Gammaproteobacteria bacterium]